MMLELALQLVGMKLTGKIDDARQIAMKIVNSNQDTFSKIVRGNDSPTHYHKATESLVLQVLRQLEITPGARLDLNLQNMLGLNLLILATILGSHPLVKVC